MFIYLLFCRYKYSAEHEEHLSRLPNLRHITFSGVFNDNKKEVFKNLNPDLPLEIVLFRVIGKFDISSHLAAYANTLTKLQFDSWQTSVFPDFFLELVNLEYLKISSAVFSILPENIGRLKKLRVLHFILAGNKLPESFCKLENLFDLSIDGHKSDTHKRLGSDADGMYLMF